MPIYRSLNTWGTYEVHSLKCFPSAVPKSGSETVRVCSPWALRNKSNKESLCVCVCVLKTRELERGGMKIDFSFSVKNV